MSNSILTRWPDDEQGHANFARNFLRYNPLTGEVIWRVNRGKSRAGDKAGSVMAHGYLQIELAQKKHLLHRVCWLIHYGSWPCGVIDHINGNRSDNRIANLRSVTQLENSRNSSLRSDNKSGVVGVSRCDTTKKWVAKIQLGPNLKYKNLGRFASKIDAINARKNAEAQIGFHQNHGKNLQRVKKNSI